jgi:maleylpyruvate isomerase
MRLYSYWRSSSAWRVRIGLSWKGIPYTYEAVHLVKDGGQQHSDTYRGKNPMGFVPMLEHRFPAPPLLPADPFLRARSLQLAEMVNSGIQPFQNLSTLGYVKAIGVDDRAWIQHFLPRGLTALEKAVQETAGKFSVGDAPTLADAYLVPQMYGARRFKLDLAPYPTLVRIDAACEALPAFQAAHPDRQPDAELAPR